MILLCRAPFVRDPTGKVFRLSLLSGNRDIAVDGIPFPCGQCLPCRINRRRVWTHRLILELYNHDAACFVTLTYDDEHLPSSGLLYKPDLQLFLKRLRRSVEPTRIRFYACGEYGSVNMRPHYHLILFGISSDFSSIIDSCWRRGMIHVGECTPDSIQYVAGYVTKKMIKKTDGIPPEFATMSRRPGIGFLAVDKLVELFQDPKFCRFFDLKNNFPTGLKHDRKLLPFGRYLSDQLHKKLEVDSDVLPFIREMHSRWLEAVHSGKYSENFLANSLIDESHQRNLQIDFHEKLKRRDGI